MSIQDYFVARPTKAFVELDYAQLEIRVLALATGDKQLILDINNGQDMHKYFASKIFNKPESQVSKEERKVAKGFSFQLQYGAGAKGIARFWDVDQNLTEKFIDEYYTRYFDVEAWQRRIQKETQDSLHHCGDMKDGESVPRFYIPSIWRNSSGEPITTYTVLGDISRYSGKAFAPPTKCKNYPIQGAASDIMMIMLNKLAQEVARLPITLLNTVHDSVLCEVRGHYIKEEAEYLSSILSKVPQALHKTFSIKSPVPFPVDYSFGNSLSEVKNVV